jgi:integrating conjugative element membrane protein (TIGR03745 family)
MKKIKQTGFSLVMTIVAVSSGQVFAALPTPVNPSTNNKTATDWLSIFKGYFQDGGLVIGLILAVGALIWIAWHILADLQQVRAGRKEMGELALSGVSGAAVLLMVMYLADQAKGIIT